MKNAVSRVRDTAASCPVFRFTDSNSHAPAFSRHCARWALSFPPSQGEGGGSAERRVVNKPRRISRIAGKQRHTATPLGAPPRRLKTPVRSSGDVATLGDFAPHACPRPARLLAEPHSGPGRKPEASRVRGATLAPRPQAPLLSQRSKASYRNAPSCGIGCLGVYTFHRTDQERDASTIREYIPERRLP